MDPVAMKPFGTALLDYYHGDHEATISLCFDNGSVFPTPVEEFFREPRSHEMEGRALDLCRGRVLDVGAGAGIHSLYLQQQGFDVCAIDICPEAVSILRERGVHDVRRSDIMAFGNETFDTLLMLGHNIGMIETLDNLEPFLRHARRLVVPGGQIVLDSLDVRVNVDPVSAAYHQENIDAGRYIGEMRFCIEYAGSRGPLFGWLHVDSETLAHHAARTGWHSRVIMDQPDGNYLARLVRD